MLTVYWAVITFGFAIALYGLKELVSPSRPKVPNDFVRNVFTLDLASIFFAVGVLVYGPLGYLQGIPSRVCVRRSDSDTGGGCLEVRLNRATKLVAGCLRIDPVTLVLPLGGSNIVSAGPWTDCVDKACNFPFQVAGGINIRAKRFYVTTQGKDTIIVTRSVDGDGAKGVIVQASDDCCAYYPPEDLRAKFLEALLADDPAGGAARQLLPKQVELEGLL
jgi:hypothetical protein